MLKTWLASTLLAVPLFASPPLRADPKKPTPAPATECPAAVKSAVERAFPKASISKCKAEREHGHDQFEVKLVRADGGKVEVDVTPEGKITETEEPIAVDKVPGAVLKAFAAKYPKAKVDTAEKQTPADGAASYELAFATDAGRKEATFTEDGKFVEEE